MNFGPGQKSAAMTRAWIASGGNLGNVVESFQAACRFLAEHHDLQLVHCSGIYRTAPVGSAAGSAYLNAASCWETTLSPLELLELLQRAERAAGRTREVHWGPRTLDLDLVQFGEIRVRDSRLVVPHPAAWYRRFVLDPVCEFGHDVLHPLHRKTWGELRRRLLDRPLPVSVTGGNAEARASLVTTLTPEFPDASLHAADSAGQIPDAGLRIWLGTALDGASTPPPPLSVDGSRWGSQAIEQLRYVLASALDAPARIGDWPAAVGP